MFMQSLSIAAALIGAAGAGIFESSPIDLAISLANAVQQSLQVPCQVGEFALGAKYQQVVFLWLARLIMDLLTDHEKHLTFFLAIIPLKTLDPYVVVCDNHRV